MKCRKRNIFLQKIKKEFNNKEKELLINYVVDNICNIKNIREFNIFLILNEKTQKATLYSCHLDFLANNHS